MTNFLYKTSMFLLNKINYKTIKVYAQYEVTSMRAGQASAANPAHYSPGQSFQVIFFRSLAFRPLSALCSLSYWEMCSQAAQASVTQLTATSPLSLLLLSSCAWVAAHSGSKCPELAKNKFTWCDFTQTLSGLSTSISVNYMPFIFKSFQIATATSMISQFQGFLDLIFGGFLLFDSTV